MFTLGNGEIEFMRLDPNIVDKALMMMMFTIGKLKWDYWEA